MGSMNALGHLLCVCAGGSTEELWDFACTIFERLDGRVTLGPAPNVHGFPPALGAPRYCFHPTGEPDIEFRGNELLDVLTQGAVYLAKLLPEDELWRRS